MKITHDDDVERLHELAAVGVDAVRVGAAAHDPARRHA